MDVVIKFAEGFMNLFRHGGEVFVDCVWQNKSAELCK